MRILLCESLYCSCSLLLKLPGDIAQGFLKWFTQLSVRFATDLRGFIDTIGPCPCHLVTPIEASTIAVAASTSSRLALYSSRASLSADWIGTSSTPRCAFSAVSKGSVE